MNRVIIQGCVLDGDDVRAEYYNPEFYGVYTRDVGCLSQHIEDYPDYDTAKFVAVSIAALDGREIIDFTKGGDES